MNVTSKTAVSTDFFKRPIQYPGSQALVVPSGRALLFTQGMTARDAKGDRVAPYDAAGQAARIFQQIGALVEEAGGTIADVIYMTVFVTNMNDVPAIQAERDRIWDPLDAPPVSSTIEIQRLVTDDAKIEVHAICSVPDRPQTIRSS